MNCGVQFLARAPAANAGANAWAVRVLIQPMAVWGQHALQNSALGEQHRIMLVVDKRYQHDLCESPAHKKYQKKNSKKVKQKISMHFQAVGVAPWHDRDNL